MLAYSVSNKISIGLGNPYFDQAIYKSPVDFIEPNTDYHRLPSATDLPHRRCSGISKLSHVLTKLQI